MAKHTYKGITFAEGWNGTFEQFREQFENTHVFKGLQQKDRLAKMKEVFGNITKNEPKESKQ